MARAQQTRAPGVGGGDHFASTNEGPNVVNLSQAVLSTSNSVMSLLKGDSNVHFPRETEAILCTVHGDPLESDGLTLHLCSSPGLLHRGLSTHDMALQIKKKIPNSVATVWHGALGRNERVLGLRQRRKSGQNVRHRLRDRLCVGHHQYPHFYRFSSKWSLLLSQVNHTYKKYPIISSLKPRLLSHLSCAAPIQVLYRSVFGCKTR